MANPVVFIASTTLEKHLAVWCGQCLNTYGYDCTFATEECGEALGVLRIRGCIRCGPWPTTDAH